jgi:putative effector of murein hydrolase LrgA (UPF0299 family)
MMLSTCLVIVVTGFCENLIPEMKLPRKKKTKKCCGGTIL